MVGVGFVSWLWVVAVVAIGFGFGLGCGIAHWILGKVLK